MLTRCPGCCACSAPSRRAGAPASIRADDVASQDWCEDRGASVFQGARPMTITIRRASPNDAAAYAHLMSDPAVFGGLMQMPYPDEELWRVRLADTCAPGKIDLPLAAELHGDVVGSAGLHPGPATRRRHA